MHGHTNIKIKKKSLFSSLLIFIFPTLKSQSVPLISYVKNVKLSLRLIRHIPRICIRELNTYSWHILNPFF